MRTENHVLQSSFFVPQYAKISRELLLSFRLFGISKTFMHITVFLRFFLSHSTEKFLEEPSKVSERFKCQVSKGFMQKNGISRFSVEIFLSRCRKISLGNTSVCQNSAAIEKLHDWVVDITFLRWIFFTYTAYKIRWGTPLCFRIFGKSKTFMLSRGDLAFFRCFSLALQYWHIAWVTPSNFRSISGIETFYAWDRKITSFSRIFCPTVRKNFPGTTSKLQKFWDLENFYAYNGFPSIFFVSQYRKISWGTI